jgi:hypothetical protein
VTVHALGTIGRYRPNKVARENGNKVSEYVVEISRPNAVAAVAAAG